MSCQTKARLRENNATGALKANVSGKREPRTNTVSVGCCAEGDTNCGRNEK